MSSFHFSIYLINRDRWCLKNWKFRKVNGTHIWIHWKIVYKILNWGRKKMIWRRYVKYRKHKYERLIYIVCIRKKSHNNVLQRKCLFLYLIWFISLYFILFFLAFEPFPFYIFLSSSSICFAFSSRFYRSFSYTIVYIVQQ